MLLPQPVVDKIVDKGTEFVPVIGTVSKFSRKAKQITKISNPVTATTRGVGLVVVTCTGPVIKYPALCAAGVDFGEQILEEL